MVMRAFFPAAAMAMTLAALSGCATPPPTPASGQLSAQDLAQSSPMAHAWHGRFSVKYEDPGISHSVRNAYGNFDWSEARNGDITLQLRTPFGQTLAAITATRDDATLTVPGRAPLVAGDVVSLMQDALGFSLPVEGLRSWLRAMPGSGPASVRADPQYPQRITQIIQDGWTIDYTPYADTAAAHGGVTRMNLSRMDSPIEIRIVIDQ